MEARKLWKSKHVINREMKSRVRDFEDAMQGIDPETDKKVENFDFLEWFHYYVLSYEYDSKYKAKKMVLSWGGPDDFFLFHDDGTIEYYYSNWMDYAVCNVTGSNYAVMRKVFNRLKNLELEDHVLHCSNDGDSPEMQKIINFIYNE